MKFVCKVFLLFALGSLALVTNAHAQSLYEDTDVNQGQILEGKYTILNNKFDDPDADQTVWRWRDGPAWGWGAYINKTSQGIVNVPAAVLGWHWSPPRAETQLPAVIWMNDPVVTRANWQITGDSSRRLNVGYSLWFHSQEQLLDGLNYLDTPAAKIAVWLHDEGGVQPEGIEQEDTVFIQGVRWQVWRHIEGGTQTTTFRSDQGAVNNREFRLNEFIIHAVYTERWMTNGLYLSGVEFGSEVETAIDTRFYVDNFYIDVDPGEVAPQPQTGGYANASLLDIVPASVDINVQLDGWWQDYKNNRTYSFLQEGEMVTRTRFVDDLLGSESTNSEFQGVALTLAVYADDQVVFDQLWRYTENHLGDSTAPGLMPYLINSDGSIQDRNTASDGDRDIAFALIAAHEKWGSANTDFDYEGAAQAMLDAIWKEEVITPSFPAEWDSNPENLNRPYEQEAVIRDDDENAYYPDLYYMTVGNWAKTPDNMFVGVAYASPATLRVFDAFTNNPNHDWERVANDFYTILDRTFLSMTSASGATVIDGRTYIGSHPASNGLLLPAWTLPTGQSLDSQQFSVSEFAGPDTYDSYLNFARDSARLPIHLMMDYAWFPNADQGGKAESWIDRINMHFNDLSSFFAINDGYDLDGGTWRFGGIYENAFYGSLAAATMRNTIDYGEGDMNAWRQSAWNDGFATFTVDGDLYSDDWRLYSAFFLGFEMQNPLQF